MKTQREIKFRAWHKETRLPVYPILDITNSFNDSYIIEQYTGLKDKNGIEIFEGDIIKTEHGASGIVVYDNLTAKFTFNCKEPMWAHPIHIMNGEKEVIGNIHENPELLK